MQKSLPLWGRHPLESGCGGIWQRALRLPARALFLSAKITQHPQNQDDRQRNADEPQKSTFKHRNLLTVEPPRGINAGHGYWFGAMNSRDGEVRNPGPARRAVSLGRGKPLVSRPGGASSCTLWNRSAQLALSLFKPPPSGGVSVCGAGAACQPKTCRVAKLRMSSAFACSSRL